MFGNSLGKSVHMVSPAEIKDWMDQGKAVIIDVREPDEFTGARIPGAVNLPLSSFDVAQLPSVPEGSKLVFHCRSGQRCGMAAAHAVSAGFTGEINRMEGGILGWHALGFPLE